MGLAPSAQGKLHQHLFLPPCALQLLHRHARNSEAVVSQVRSDLPPVGRRQRQGCSTHHGGGLPDPGGRPAIEGWRFAEELGFSTTGRFPPRVPPSVHTHTHTWPPLASRLLALLVLLRYHQWDWRCCVLCIKSCLRSFIACHKTAIQVKLKVSFGCLPTLPVRAGPVPLAAYVKHQLSSPHLLTALASSPTAERIMLE